MGIGSKRGGQSPFYFASYCCLILNRQIAENITTYARKQESVVTIDYSLYGPQKRKPESGLQLEQPGPPNGAFAEILSTV